MCYADPKTGKSILSVQLAHCLGTKAPFLDRRVEGDWKVLYVQADLPAQEWLHQLKVLDSNTGWDTIVLPPAALAQPKMFTDAKEMFKDYNFIILDALVSLFGYPDLKADSSAGSLLSRIRDLTDNPVWLIHHKRKAMAGIPDRMNQSAAGSFALAAGVSSLYELSSYKLCAKGRVISTDLDLTRDSVGRWKIDRAYNI